jgi:O-antigen/teichoic acid export membrane protein
VSSPRSRAHRAPEITVENNSLGRDFAIVLAGQLMAFLQGLILLPIVIPLAGAAVYGAYVLIMSIVGLLFGVLGYGIPYRYQRSLASAPSFAERRRLFEPQFTFQLLAVALLSGAAVAFGSSLNAWLFQGTAYATSWFLVALLVAKLLDRQALDYFQYTQRFLPFSLSSVGAPYLFVLMLAVVAWIGRGFALDTLLVLQVVTSLAASAPLLFVLLRELGLPRLHLPWRQLIADARIGLPLMLELIIDFLLRSSDRYLILLFLSVTDVGRYQPAYVIGSVAIFLVSMSETILLPAMSRLVDAGNRADAEQLIATLLRLFLMLGVPVVAGALMIGPSLVGSLSTPEIGLASRWVTPLVALATLFYGVARLASTVAYVLGRTPLILMANASGAAVNLMLNLALLPLLRDITVPAATTVIGYVVDCLYVAWAFRGLWPLRIEWAAVLRYAVAAAAMGGVLWVLGFRPGAVAGVGALSLAGSIGVGIATYFAALAATGGFGRREIAQLASIARRRMPDAGQAA